MLLEVIPFVVLLSIHTTIEYSHYNPYRRPILMGDKIPLKALSPHRAKIQRKIVLYHNYFRSKVQPSPANMLKMKWHKGAAKAAERWAEKCMSLIHDNSTGRYVDNYGTCGQNIFIASHKVPWLFAIKTWYLEKNDFNFGKKNNLTIVGHYTQMVWAATHEVGCGLAKCNRMANMTSRVYYSYICNYCPIGNRPGRVGHPYRKGKPCSLCKNSCNVKLKLCTNSCPYVNDWRNCKQLYMFSPNWLCYSNSPDGKERRDTCKATCLCKGKIYD